MIFTEIELKGAFIIEPNRIEDERGFFARSWRKKEFENHQLNPHLMQCNISFNKKKGTLRGMHYQIKPYEEAKLVRCTMGAIFDVIIDIRLESDTFLQWFSVELNAENRNMLYIPKGFAHGFQTIVDNSEVFYQMSEFYAPDYARGLRWNDPLFRINWPENITSISTKDKNYKDFEPNKL